VRGVHLSAQFDPEPADSLGRPGQPDPDSPPAGPWLSVVRPGSRSVPPGARRRAARHKPLCHCRQPGPLGRQGIRKGPLLCLSQMDPLGNHGAGGGGSSAHQLCPCLCSCLEPNPVELLGAGRSHALPGPLGAVLAGGPAVPPAGGDRGRRIKAPSGPATR